MTTRDKAKRATVAIGPSSVETALSAAVDALAEPDIRTEREARLEQQLRDAGIEPWELSRERND